MLDLFGVWKHCLQIFEKIHLWWGYVRLHANGTTLHFQAMSDLDDSQIDELIIRKPVGWGARWHATHQNSIPARTEVCLTLFLQFWQRCFPTCLCLSTFSESLCWITPARTSCAPTSWCHGGVLISSRSFSRCWLSPWVSSFQYRVR